MKKLNNKGYMLVEIILAFSICFALMYFLMDIVIKVKNKNDDLLVEATVKTDQAIITNRLMEYIINEQNGFNCNITSSGKLIKYNGNTLTVVDDRASISLNTGDGFSCNNNTTNKTIKITIPITVAQMSEKDFDVVINYNYGSTLIGLPTEPEPPIGGDVPEVPTPIIPEDTTPPTCTMTVSGTTIIVTASDNVGIDASSIDSSWSPSIGNTYTKTFNSATTYTFSMTDTSGNTGSCSIEIKKKTTSIWGSSSCPYGQPSYTAIEGTDYCYR